MKKLAKRQEKLDVLKNMDDNKHRSNNETSEKSARRPAQSTIIGCWLFAEEAFTHLDLPLYQDHSRVFQQGSSGRPETDVGKTSEGPNGKSQGFIGLERILKRKRIQGSAVWNGDMS